MGYAYALGMLEVLKPALANTTTATFGSFYILAPENASAGNINLADFEDYSNTVATKKETNKHQAQETKPGTTKTMWHRKDRLRDLIRIMRNCHPIKAELISHKNKKLCAVG